MDHHTPSDPERKHKAISLGLPGICGDLFPPELIERVEPAEEPEPEPPTEAEEIDAELGELTQRTLFGKKKEKRGGRHDYDFPDPEVMVANLRRVTQRRDDVDGVPDRALYRLVETLRYFPKHRGTRKLSELDLAIQREWTEARAVGEGLVYRLAGALSLKSKWWFLCGGRRSQLRQQILALLMWCHANGWLGFTLSAPAAERCFGCYASMWWDAVRWLEGKGLLIRMRRYQNGVVRLRDFDANWYGLGPALLEHADAFVYDFDKAPEEVPEAVAAAEKRYREERRDHGRERRRRRHEIRAAYEDRRARRRAGADAPGWAVRVARAARELAEDEQVRARARRMVEGVPYSGAVPDFEGRSLTEREETELERLSLPPPGPVFEPWGPLCASSESRASPGDAKFSREPDAPVEPNQYHPDSGWPLRVGDREPEDCASGCGPPGENCAEPGDARDSDDAQSGPQDLRTSNTDNQPHTNENPGHEAPGSLGRKLLYSPRRGDTHAAARTELGRSLAELRKRNPVLADAMAREVLEGEDP